MCSMWSEVFFSRTIEKTRLYSFRQERFTLLSGLRRHICLRIAKKSHPCLFCDKTFIHVSTLKEHTLSHTGGSGSRDSNKRCTRSSNQKSQLCVDEGEKPNSQCGQVREMSLDTRFVQNSADKDDQHLHQLESKVETNVRILNDRFCCCEEEKPYSCSYCNQVFLEISTLKRHLSSHFEETVSSKCFSCIQGFMKEKDLQRHLETHASSNCVFCIQGFTKEKDLQRHRETHG